MIRLPVLTEIKVEHYGLFPGNPRGSGITWQFHSGLSVIAGINGLGKTTLLTMILRSFTGPYDLTGDGNPQNLTVVLPRHPVSLRQDYIRFFERRVADGAESASVSLSATFEDTTITILRRLNDLFLENFSINDTPIPLPHASAKREDIFQSEITELMGFSSFVDVLLVLHHVILFHENRPGALWDPNAQRQLLRALCLDGEDASRMVELERKLLSADSRARNIRANITSTERKWRKALRLEAGSEGVLAELEAEQAVVDAELLEADRLRENLEQLDESRKAARLAHERAKVEREQASGAIERLKYTALLSRFPTMEDTTRLILSRILTDGHCIACNAAANTKRLELERQIESGCCPICGADPQDQDNVIGPHELDQARLDRERQRVTQAREEEETQYRHMTNFSASYDKTLQELISIRERTEERKRKNQRLRSQLPDSVTSKDYENALKTLRSEHRESLEIRATHLQDLREILTDSADVITSKSIELTQVFATLIDSLLVEKVRLVPISAEPRYMQAPGVARDRLQVPAYAAEMTAADRPGFIRRERPNAVSESQRELIDLAFRLALIQVFGSSCTFVMETPEASLDGLAMERVGLALHEFANKNANRLIVTSNLANTGIINSLFGGPASNDEMTERRERILNLLEVAEPNQALLDDRERYDLLLEQAISGVLE